MARAASVSQFRSEFDEFLYAPIDENSNGTLLSVLSALARLDVDPWQEAANLARLSREGAIQRLASLIAEVPGGPPADLNCKTIAARLVALLPSRAYSNTAPRETSPAAGAAVNFRAIGYVIILNVIFAVLAFGSQYLTAGRQPPVQVGSAHAPIANVAAPKVPFPRSGQ